MLRISRALRKGVDAEGVMVAVEPFGRALDFLAALPVEVPLPDVVVESEGKIGLDWDLDPRRVLTVTVDASSTIGYSALLGYEPIYGRVPFAAAIPETVAFLLRRVHSTPHN